MAFTSEETQVFKPGLGTIQIGNYSSASTTGGFLPISSAITVFAVTLQSNDGSQTVVPRVNATFPATGQTSIEIVTATDDFGTFMIYFI